MAGEVTMLSSTWSPSGTFTGEPYLVSLRGKDPRRTSTVTMHVAQSMDSTSRCPGIRSHHFGPGMKVTGGQLGYAHEDRTKGRIRTTKCMDSADILAEFQRTRPTTTGDMAETNHSSALRTSTSHSTPTGKHGTNSFSPKVVYWDGKQHHLMDKTEGVATLNSDWEPPHLQHKDLEPGRMLGVRETGGAAGTALVGSKYRLMPQTEVRSSTQRPSLWSGPIPPPYGATKGPYGLKPYAPVDKTTSFGTHGNIDVDTLRSYASTKVVGHREYERACKSLEGMQAWRAAECDLTSSMAIGHSTYQMSPKEHMSTRLSLRRT